MQLDQTARNCIIRSWCEDNGGGRLLSALLVHIIQLYTALQSDGNYADETDDIRRPLIDRNAQIHTGGGGLQSRQ